MSVKTFRSGHMMRPQFTEPKVRPRAKHWMLPRNIAAAVIITFLTTIEVQRGLPAAAATW